LNRFYSARYTVHIVGGPNIFPYNFSILKEVVLMFVQLTNELYVYVTFDFNRAFI
jgi:hypothetical protein